MHAEASARLVPPRLLQHRAEGAAPRELSARDSLSPRGAQRARARGTSTLEDGGTKSRWRRTEQTELTAQRAVHRVVHNRRRVAVMARPRASTAHEVGRRPELILDTIRILVRIRRGAAGGEHEHGVAVRDRLELVARSSAPMAVQKLY